MNTNWPKDRHALEASIERYREYREKEEARWGPRHPGVPGASSADWQQRAELLLDMVNELLGGGHDGWNPDVNGEFSMSDGCAWCGSFSGHDPAGDAFNAGLADVLRCPWARWRHFLTGSTEG